MNKKKYEEWFVCPRCMSDNIGEEKRRDLWIDGVCFDGMDYYYCCKDCGWEFESPERILALVEDGEG